MSDITCATSRPLTELDRIIARSRWIRERTEAISTARATAPDIAAISKALDLSRYADDGDLERLRKALVAKDDAQLGVVIHALMHEAWSDLAEYEAICEIEKIERKSQIVAMRDEKREFEMT